MGRARLWGLMGVLLVLSSGCDSQTAPDPADYDFEVRADNLAVMGLDGLLFLKQEIVPDIYMDADYQGPVTADASGCMRLASEGTYEVTAIWPEGYELRQTSASAEIVDRSGNTVGLLGETFDFSGGEVEQLTSAAGFTEADQDLAAERCPGRYWVVAP